MIKNQAGARIKKCSSRQVCLVKFYFGGLTPTPGLQSPPHQMGVYALRIGEGGSIQKMLLKVSLHSKILFLGESLQFGPVGSTPPNRGICFENWVGARKQKWLLWVGLLSKILLFGAYPNLVSSLPKGGVCF